MFHQDPRYIMWLKNEPSSLLDTTSDFAHKELFKPSLTAFQLANSVRYHEIRQGEDGKWKHGDTVPKKTYLQTRRLHTGMGPRKRLAKERNGTKLFDSSLIRTRLARQLMGLGNASGRYGDLAGGQGPHCHLPKSSFNYSDFDRCAY